MLQRIHVATHSCCYMLACVLTLPPHCQLTSTTTTQKSLISCEGINLKRLLGLPTDKGRGALQELEPLALQAQLLPHNMPVTTSAACTRPVTELHS